MIDDGEISEVLTTLKTLKIFTVVGMKQSTLNGFKVLEKQKHENLEFVNCSYSRKLIYHYPDLKIILENYCPKFKTLLTEENK